MLGLWNAADEDRRTAEAVYVYAEEKDSGGRRRYITTTIDCMWRRMGKLLKRGTRPGVGAGHFYEVIRLGQPCHLYFDIEYKRAHNPDIDGGRLTELFIEFVLQQLAMWQPQHAQCDLSLP